MSEVIITMPAVSPYDERDPKRIENLIDFLDSPDMQDRFTTPDDRLTFVRDLTPGTLEDWTSRIAYILSGRNPEGAHYAQSEDLTLIYGNEELAYIAPHRESRSKLMAEALEVAQGLQNTADIGALLGLTCMVTQISDGANHRTGTAVQQLFSRGYAAHSFEGRQNYRDLFNTSPQNTLDWRLGRLGLAFNFSSDMAKEMISQDIILNYADRADLPRDVRGEEYDALLFTLLAERHFSLPLMLHFAEEKGYALERYIETHEGLFVNQFNATEIISSMDNNDVLRLLELHGIMKESFVRDIILSFIDEGIFDRNMLINGFKAYIHNRRAPSAFWL